MILKADFHCYNSSILYKMLMHIKGLGPVVQSVFSFTSSLKVISLTVLVDSIYSILIFFAEKMWVAFAMQCLMQCKSYSHFLSKKFQYICVSLDVNFNVLLTNVNVSFEQLGPEMYNTIRSAMSRSVVVVNSLVHVLIIWLI